MDCLLKGLKQVAAIRSGSAKVVPFVLGAMGVSSICSLRLAASNCSYLLNFFNPLVHFM